MSRRRKKRCFVSQIFRGRLMRLLRKCVISPKMTKTEGHNTESFVKTIRTTMMNGMIISIMAILLLMMLSSSSRVAGYPMAPVIQATPAFYV
jgi:hypothetical protein